MSGNGVRTSTASAYSRTSEPDSSARVLRGGSWLNRATAVRSAFRDHGHPSNSSLDVGFRVARALP